MFASLPRSPLSLLLPPGAWVRDAIDSMETGDEGTLPPCHVLCVPRQQSQHRLQLGLRLVIVSKEVGTDAPVGLGYRSKVHPNIYDNTTLFELRYVYFYH